ncbi:MULTISPECIES: helix-turn-helix domain-containing protein [Pseudomonadota]|uniref:winged helix-turn-helix transcriptional regulator n=1 Tax=Pseudomonadota TaxID=1224 RepID=UPI000A81A264|nr:MULTISPECIES: helix-turn-helix domain-containing protein [Pseudomonadota]
MPKRLYDDACGTAHALELIGERWALLVMRELMLGPRRFSELRADLPGISANVLTQRLEGLEEKHLLVRRRLPPPASAQVYELTPWGYEAEPLVQMLGRWAARSPWHDPTLPISGVSVMLSFRTMIDRARVGDLAIRAGFVFGDMTYVGELDRTGIAIARGEAEGCDLVFTGTPHALAGAVYGGVPLAELQSGGQLTVTGDPQLIVRFLTLFPLPEKVELHPE